MSQRYESNYDIIRAPSSDNGMFLENTWKKKKQGKLDSYKGGTYRKLYRILKNIKGQNVHHTTIATLKTNLDLLDSYAGWH